MFRAIWALVIAGAVGQEILPAARGESAAGRRFAVLVGVTTYEHASFNNLTFTERDATELGKVLGGGGYSIVILSESLGKKQPDRLPTRKNILAQLRALGEKCRRQDTVLFAFAGHGLQFAGKTESFLCPREARPKDPKTLLALSEVYKHLSDSGAGVRLVLIDACRTEPVQDRSTGANATTGPRPPRGTAALFSCSGGQQAFESAKIKHGVFFYFVMKGLRGEAKNTKGEVSWSRLAEYVSERVPAEVPTLIGGGAVQEPNEVKDLSGRPPLLLARSWVQDEGKFFQAETLRMANNKIQEITEKYKKDVVVETIPPLTADPEKKLKEEDKNLFFARLALKRSKELGLNGVYIVFCKNPQHYQIHMDPGTQKKVFTVADRKKLAAIIVKRFKEGKFDAGLLDGLELIGSTLQANTR